MHAQAERAGGLNFPSALVRERKRERERERGKREGEKERERGRKRERERCRIWLLNLFNCF